MLPDKPVNQRLTALNTAYLLMGMAGLLYYMYGFWSVNRLPATAAVNAAAAKNHHQLLLFISLLQMALGIYVFQSVKKTFLFLQSLATMFMLTAEGLVVYQFHAETTIGTLGTDLAAWAGWVLMAAILLHALARMEHRFKQIKITTV
jgi:cytochrome b561